MSLFVFYQLLFMFFSTECQDASIGILCDALGSFIAPVALCRYFIGSFQL
ncbi:hypothetical protein GLYMA_18G184150v4 [Glycine max]|nr:hypothetical protein GLYMA_18G184150v4 [Glycine max]KAH1155061.1 hypothetical protein GYH30_050383 [Glycine max]